MPERLLVTGAGGFIGGHLVANLLREGNEVRAVESSRYKNGISCFRKPKTCSWIFVARMRVSARSGMSH
jgi:nucleoside-diphosphate-sugar epimerase